MPFVFWWFEKFIQISLPNSSRVQLIFESKKKKRMFSRQTLEKTKSKRKKTNGATATATTAHKFINRRRKSTDRSIKSSKQRTDSGELNGREVAAKQLSNDITGFFYRPAFWENVHERDLTYMGNHGSSKQNALINRCELISDSMPFNPVRGNVAW